MEKSRYFNKIEIISDFVIKKSSADKHKMKAEYEWYKHNDIYMTPTIISYWEENDIASYTMEYIHGSSMARQFIYGNICTAIDIAQTFENLYNYCTKTVYKSIYFDNYTKMLIQSMYSDKTYSRLAETDIDIDKEFIINNRHTPTIRQIIEDCPVYIYDKNIRPIHGDLCFSNILLEGLPNNPTVIVIDPRGFLPDGTITNIGDINYDVAKLAHSVIGRYDQIKNNWGFTVNKVNDNEYTYNIQTTSWQEVFVSEFYNHFSDFEYYNILIHLFLSMIPLHKDNPVHQEKMLVNALRLYLEKDQ